MIFKFTSGQGVYLTAYDDAGLRAGDAANITTTISKDGSTPPAATATVSPVEIGDGLYWQPLSQAETDANAIALIWSSSTVGVQIDPFFGYTSGGAVPAVVAGASGGLPTVDGANGVKISVGTGGGQVSLANGVASANVIQWGGSAIVTPLVPGVPEVDIAYVDAQAASLTTNPVPANVTQWNGTNVPTPDAAGYPKVTVKSGTGSGEVNLTGGNLAGSVAAVTEPVAVADKTGFSLSATGLDAISVIDPGKPANHTTLPRMLVALWRRSFTKATLSSTQYLTYADDGTTVNSTQAVSDDGIVQTMGTAS